MNNPEHTTEQLTTAMPVEWTFDDKNHEWAGSKGKVACFVSQLTKDVPWHAGLLTGDAPWRADVWIEGIPAVSVEEPSLGDLVNTLRFTAQEYAEELFGTATDLCALVGERPSVDKAVVEDVLVSYAVDDGTISITLSAANSQNGWQGWAVIGDSVFVETQSHYNDWVTAIIAARSEMMTKLATVATLANMVLGEKTNA